MISDLQVNISLVNQKVKFVGVSELNAGTPITFDFLPPLGDGEGYAGLELLLMSFSGCVSTAVVVLLRRMGKNITGYSANVTGIRSENPLSLKKIIYEAVIESDDTDDIAAAAALKKAEEISPVWLAVKNNVEVETAYKIVSQKA